MMFNLAEFAKANTKPIYVYLADNPAAQRFLRNAENHGFTFSDGTKPTQKHISDFYAVHSDMTISYLGAIGRMAYQCGAKNIIRMDYAAGSAEGKEITDL